VGELLLGWSACTLELGMWVMALIAFGHATMIVQARGGWWDSWRVCECGFYFFSVACTLECPAQELILGEVGRCRSAAGKGGEGSWAAADVGRGARAETENGCVTGRARMHCVQVLNSQDVLRYVSPI